MNRYYDPGTGQFLNVDPIVDVTQQPYAYASDDPVNEMDPAGLSSELSASQQESFYGLLESLSSNLAVSGEAPTLGNEVSTLGAEYGSLQECRKINVGDPSFCFAYPGRSNLSLYLTEGGSACLLSQITSDERTGHNQAADFAVLAAFGVVPPSGPDTMTLYRAVEQGELQDIRTSGSYRVPEGIGEGKYFYPSAEQASNFAEMNPGRTYVLTSGQFSAEVIKGSWVDAIGGEGQAYFIPSEYFPSGPVDIGDPIP